MPQGTVNGHWDTQSDASVTGAAQALELGGVDIRL